MPRVRQQPSFEGLIAGLMTITNDMDKVEEESCDNANGRIPPNV